MNTSYSNRPLGGFSPSQTYFPSGVTYSLLHKSLGILLLQREQGAWARLEEFPWNIRVAVGFNNWHNTNMAHVAKICQIISPGSKLYPLGPHDYGPCHVLEAELQWLWTSWPRVRNFWGPNSSWAPLTVGPCDELQLLLVMLVPSYPTPNSQTQRWMWTTEKPWSQHPTLHPDLYQLHSGNSPQMAIEPWMNWTWTPPLSGLKTTWKRNKLTPLVQQCATCIFDNVPASLAFSIYHRVGQYPN